MRALLHVVLVALATVTTVQAQNETTKKEEPRQRIGVYDSRAVAIAYAGSAVQKEVSGSSEPGEKLTHREAIMPASVEYILKRIGDRLSAIMQKANVTDITSKWNKDELGKHPSAKRVDITLDLVDALCPTERQRKMAIKIQKVKPFTQQQTRFQPRDRGQPLEETVVKDFGSHAK